MKIGNFKLEIKPFVFAGQKTLKITVVIDGEIISHETVFEENDFETTYRRYVEGAARTLEQAIIEWGKKKKKL